MQDSIPTVLFIDKRSPRLSHLLQLFRCCIATIYSHPREARSLRTSGETSSPISFQTSACTPNERASRLVIRASQGYTARPSSFDHTHIHWSTHQYARSSGLLKHQEPVEQVICDRSKPACRAQTWIRFPGCGLLPRARPIRMTSSRDSLRPSRSGYHV